MSWQIMKCKVLALSFPLVNTSSCEVISAKICFAVHFKVMFTLKAWVNLLRTVQKIKMLELIFLVKSVNRKRTNSFFPILSASSNLWSAILRLSNRCPKRSLINITTKY